MVLNTNACYTRNPLKADARMIERLINEVLVNSWSTLPPMPFPADFDWAKALDPLVEIDSGWDALAA